MTYRVVTFDGKVLFEKATITELKGALKDRGYSHTDHIEAFDGVNWIGSGSVVAFMGDTTFSKPEPDMVNHPPHYTAHPKGIECIDVIEDNPFLNLGNAMKYIWRVSWGSKGRDIEDLEKAVWYVQREIKRRQKKA